MSIKSLKEVMSTTLYTNIIKANCLSQVCKSFSRHASILGLVSICFRLTLEIRTIHMSPGIFITSLLCLLFLVAHVDRICRGRRIRSSRRAWNFNYFKFLRICFMPQKSLCVYLSIMCILFNFG